MRFIQTEEAYARFCFLLSQPQAAQNIVPPPNVYFYLRLQSSRAKDSSDLKWISASIEPLPETNNQQPGTEQMQHYVYELPGRTSGLFKYSRAEQKESVRVHLGLHVERELSNVFISVRLWYSDWRGGIKKKTSQTEKEEERKEKRKQHGIWSLNADCMWRITFQ